VSSAQLVYCVPIFLMRVMPHALQRLDDNLRINLLTITGHGISCQAYGVMIRMPLKEPTTKQSTAALNYLAGVRLTFGGESMHPKESYTRRTSENRF
jgi:hypothetical protein